MIKAHAPGRKNAGDQISRSYAALVFSRISEQARRAACSHPKQNPVNRWKFQSVRSNFAFFAGRSRTSSGVWLCKPQFTQRALQMEPMQRWRLMLRFGQNPIARHTRRTDAIRWITLWPAWPTILA